MVLILTKLLLDEKNLLSKVWLAAHWDKKLSKYHIYQINIEKTVQHMMTKEIILDLRLSGHLLVGIVRIFSRKTIYLLNECNNIFSRVRIFHQGSIDLPAHKRELPMNMVTLPEQLENVGDLNEIKLDKLLSNYQSRPADITLQETERNIRLIEEDFDENYFNEMNHGGFDDDDPNFMALVQKDKELINGDQQKAGIDSVSSDGMDTDFPCAEMNFGRSIENEMNSFHVSENENLIKIKNALIYDEEKHRIELILKPLPNFFNISDHVIRKKRKLIIDEVRKLDREKMKKQITDNCDTTVPLDLAPPTKRLKMLKEIGNTEKLLRYPGLKLNSDKTLYIYQRNLKFCKVEDISSESSGDESAYGSIERPQPCSNSEDLFPDDLIEFHDSVNDHIDFAAHNRHDEGIELNVEPTHFNDARITNDLNKSFSQSLNFSDQFHQETSSNGGESELSNLQDKIASFLKFLASSLKDNESLKFSKIVQNEKRAKVAQYFHFLLMLKKFQIVELKQEKCYGEIAITRGVNFMQAYSELC